MKTRKSLIKKLLYLFGFIVVICLIFIIPDCVLGQEISPKQIGQAYPEISTTQSPLPFGVLELKFEKGLLTLKAEKADLADLLKKIAEVSGIALEIAPGISGTVSLSFTNLELEDGINHILESVDSKNYAASFNKVGEGTEEDYRLKKVVVVKKGEGLPGGAGVSEEVPRTAQGVKEYLKKKYGTEWHVFWDGELNRPDSIIGLVPVEKAITEVVAGKGFIWEKIEELSSLLGINLNDMYFQDQRNDGETFGYSYLQKLGGVLIEGGRVGASINKDFKKGYQQIRIANYTYPDISISTEPKLSVEEAVRVAEGEHRRTFPQWNYFTDIRGYDDLKERYRNLIVDPEMIILPRGIPDDNPTRYDYYLVYKIKYMTCTYYVDARTGNVVWSTFDTRRLTATIRGMVYPDNESNQNNDNLVPLKNLNVIVDNAPPIHTNAQGEYVYNQGDAVSLNLESTVPADEDLKGRSFVILDANDLSWTFNQAGDYAYPRDQENGFRPNVYYWADEAFTWFKSNLGMVINFNEATSAIGQTKIYADQEINALGISNNNLEVLFKEDRPATDGDPGSLASSIMADIILHELTHAAAYALRGGFIAPAPEQEKGAVSEGLSDYFACRITGDKTFAKGPCPDACYDLDFLLDGTTERTPEDWNNDQQITNQDWEHYNNGEVIASILWDLNQGTGGISDQIIWGAIHTDFLATGKYRPEDLYVALVSKSLDAGLDKATLLWTSFSIHGVNLWARPDSGGGVALDWFPHYGSSAMQYYVYRNADEADLELESSCLPGPFNGTVMFDAVSPLAGDQPYYYAVRAVYQDASGQTVLSPFSNHVSSIAEPSGGIKPSTPQNLQLSRQELNGVKGVLLSWEKVNDTDLSRYVIERAIDSQFTQEAMFLPHVPGDTLSKQDFNYGLGFTENVEYFYRIYAVDLADLWSDPSAYRSIIPNDTLAPKKISDVINETSDSMVTLQWTPVDKNADDTPIMDLAGYRIYYDIDEPGAPYNGTGANEGDSPVLIPVSASNPVEFQLTGLSSDGTTYFIAVTAVDEAGNESALSNWAMARPVNAEWVPADYGSIQDAVDAAGAGGVVMVSPGTYEVADGYFRMKYDVEVRSEAGPDRTEIVAPDGAMSVVDGRSGGALIGFTVRNALFGVDLMFDNGVRVRNNVITGNRVGMYIGGVDRATEVANNTIVANELRGLLFAYGGDATVRNNIIAGNGDWGIYRFSGNPLVEYNDVWDNGPGGSGNYYNMASPGSDIQDDPRFLESAAGNYHLGRSSPCRNAGHPDTVYDDFWENWYGIAGHVRNDMGAFGGQLMTWVLDSDRDGLADWTEDANKNGDLDLPEETDPFDADTDDDGLIDGNAGSEDLNANSIFEPELGETDPRNSDTDGDGILDGTEVGLTAPESAHTDLAIFIPDIDPTTTTDPLNSDSDGDGLLDGEEDADHNGAVGAMETDPLNPDCDGDGYTDGQEVDGGSDPLDPASIPNHPPSITVLQVAQRTDGSGLAEAVFTGTDEEGDLCTLPVKEVSLDGGIWAPLSFIESDPAHTAVEPMAFAPEGSSFAAVWDVEGVFGAGGGRGGIPAAAAPRRAAGR